MKSAETTNEDSFELKNLGYDYSGLFEALSSKYCMCDVLEGPVNYTPLLSSILDISSLLNAQLPLANQMNMETNTLYAPQPCMPMPVDAALSPSTVECSPSVLKPLKDIDFSTIADSQVAQAMAAVNAQS